MNRATENKIILIVRKTRLDELIARHNTRSQAQFYLEHLGADFSDYEQEHRRYQETVQTAGEILSRLGRVQIVDRSFLPNFLFGKEDTVVVLGQDGLVANTLKYLDCQPVIGVNPDPARWDGILLPFRVEDLPFVVPDVFTERRKIRSITMAQASLSNGQVLYAVNDLFIGPRSHTSLRYSIRHAERAERQSSSGIIVSTGLGSTGWFKSILAGAEGIAGPGKGAGGKPAPARGFAWEADYLYFSVREPFPSKTSGANIVFGKITRESPLRIESHTPDTGVIFSDGIENDFLHFPSGMDAEITVSQRAGRLVI
ncbi:MAG: sugar kinase [Chloroflexi bacterium RBG_13_60_9]|nr:MAG: sugar kinase [Chloroflexi bacterium RBG_13_60_9]